MNRRIWGFILQKIFIARRSLEVFIDTLWFSVLSVIVFGFLGKYLVGAQNPEAAMYLIGGMILWEVIRINQYSLSLHPMWNIWSRNFSNMFIAPVSKAEYLISQMIGAFVETLFVFLVNVSIAATFFDFALFDLGFTVVMLHFVNLSLFAWSVGLLLIGIIFMYGTRIQALAWGAIFLLQPLMAVFFPVSVLPQALQRISYLLPPTYIFEAFRMQASSGIVRYDWIMTAFVLNIFYFILCCYLFNKMFIHAQTSGQFAKNDEG